MAGDPHLFRRLFAEGYSLPGAVERARIAAALRHADAATTLRRYVQGWKG